MQRLDRDLRQLLSVNDAFQLQTAELQRREASYMEATRDFRERGEQLKLEQERIAMKEQQFLRQVQKLEADSRKEARRLQDKHEALLKARQREWERTFEEVEDKM